VLEKVLADDPWVSGSVLQGVPLVKTLEPEVEATLIERARSDDGNTANPARRFLGLVQAKSERVVALFLEQLGSPDYSVRGPAAAALSTGVPEQLRDRVARAAVKRLAELSDFGSHVKCRKILVEYGDSEDVHRIERLAGNDLLPGWHREHLLKYADRLRGRRAEGR